MELDAPWPPHRVAIEVALRDISHVEDAHHELEAFDPAFTVSERGWTIVGITVHAPSRAEARRVAAAVVVAALDAEPLFLWLH